MWPCEEYELEIDLELDLQLAVVLVLYIYMMCTMVVSLITLSHIPDSSHANLNLIHTLRVTIALTLFSALRHL